MESAYTQMRPWSEEAIRLTLERPTIRFLTRPNGGLIAQIVAKDCEILAIATHPDAQRKGIASDLLSELTKLAKSQNVERIFLDVAAQNAPARAFYAAKGFAEIGKRRAYYTLRDGSKDDALLLSRPVDQELPLQPPNSRGV